MVVRSTRIYGLDKDSFQAGDVKIFTGMIRMSTSEGQLRLSGFERKLERRGSRSVGQWMRRFINVVKEDM